jgi:hypothetical protein
VNLPAPRGYVLDVNGLDLWRYEARRVGRHVLMAPPLLAALLLFTGLGLRRAGFAGDWLAQAVPPLVAGLVAASIVAGERDAELHLSLPTPLRTTFGRRLVLLEVSTVACALILAARLLPDVHALARFAQVCSFGTLLTAIGAWSAAALRSVAGASTVLLAAWFADLFVLDRIFSGLAARIPVQLVLAAVLAVPAVRLLAEVRGLTQGSGE